MSQFTSEQQRMIQTWTEQRDALLRDISVLTPQRDDLKKELKEGGESLTDIQNQISEVRGRLSELDALEEQKKNSVTNEVAELIARKSRLEAECIAEETKISLSKEKHEVIITAIDKLSDAHDKLADQTATVNEIVGGVIKFSEEYLTKAKDIMTEVNSVSSEVIEKGNKNIETANIVIPKLTQFVIDLQRPIPVRRVPDRQVFRHMNPSNDLKST